MDTATVLDIDRIRGDFPILARQVRGQTLTYLDSAATSQKPRQVLAAVEAYYENRNANVHRGVYGLAEEATEAFEGARDRVARFIEGEREGVIFTRNTTESLNLVASSLAREGMKPEDRIVLSVSEHHSNLVPWQLAAERAGLDLEFIQVDDEGRLDLSDFDKMLEPPTKLVTLMQVSNVLGSINPIKEVCQRAHAAGVLVCVDAAQAVPHMPVSVSDLDCDFLAFSGHKMGAPMGIGVLYGRPAVLEGLTPFMGGGSMIREVRLEGSSYSRGAQKFEAGTPDVGGAVGLGAACDYLDQIGREVIHRYELGLTRKLLEMLEGVGEIRVFGPKDLETRSGVVSFNLGDVHAHDVATILDRRGIAVRAGHHCAQPLMRRFGVDAMVRASVYLYNTEEELAKLGAGLTEVRKVFGV